MSDMSEFFTAETAEAGIKLPLFRPDGTQSEHWLKIRGVDSQEFRIAETLAKRSAAAAASIKDDRERAQMALDARTRLAASLVIDWSFDQPCTIDNVANFLKNAPQITDAIDRVSGDRALFFGIASTSFADGLTQKSNSAKSRKAAKRH